MTEGATPKDTISAKESIFLPKPNLSSRLSFLETHPSTESKTTATSMHNDAYVKWLPITIKIAKNPNTKFNIEMTSGIAKKYPIPTLFNLIIWLQIIF